MEARSASQSRIKGACVRGEVGRVLDSKASLSIKNCEFLGVAGGRKKEHRSDEEEEGRWRHGGER